MNLFYSIAAILGVVCCIGHFTYGYRRHLSPMLEQQLALEVKTSLTVLFHGVSVFLLLSALVLIACAFEVVSSMHAFGLVLFIAMNYGVLAIWQVYIARMSGLERPFKSQFQWVGFSLVAIFSLLGLFTRTCCSFS